MRRIEAQFNESFRIWDIKLPRAAIEARQRGKIVQAGWTIWFLFGADASGEYLDYYSSHRMTNDSHVRLYDDGRVEGLESLWDMHSTSDDPDEAARLEDEFWDHNERVARLLGGQGVRLARRRARLRDRASWRTVVQGVEPASPGFCQGRRSGLTTRRQAA